MSESFVFWALIGVVLQLTLDVVGRTINLLQKVYSYLLAKREA